MEDAHIACPDLSQVLKDLRQMQIEGSGSASDLDNVTLPVDPSQIAVFGVFDGHGGE